MGKRISPRTATARANAAGAVIIDARPRLVYVPRRVGRRVRLEWKRMSSDALLIRELALVLAHNRPSKWAMRGWCKNRLFRRALRRAIRIQESSP